MKIQIGLDEEHQKSLYEIDEEQKLVKPHQLKSMRTARSLRQPL